MTTSSFTTEISSDDWPEITADREITGGRPRGYIEDYRPHRKTIALLNDVIAVINEYRAYLPITIRQAYYRLIGAYGYHKGDALYDRLCEHIGNARRARLIPFSVIRDDGISVMEEPWYRDEESFTAHLNELCHAYRKDLMADQHVRIEVWCEASGMLSQLANVANEYCIPVYSCSGFDSLPAKRTIVRRAVEDARNTVILHLGDWDPSGQSVFCSVAEDVIAFFRKDRYDARQRITFKRVALTFQQVVGHRLETEPCNPKDSRTKAWIARYGNRICQLEALSPPDIAELLRTAIQDCLDLQQYSASLAQEEEEKRRVAYLLTAGGAA